MTDFRPSAFSRLILGGGSDVKIGQATRLILAGGSDAKGAQFVRMILRSAASLGTVAHLIQAPRLVLMGALGEPKVAQVARLILMSSIPASTRRRMSLM